MYILIIHRFHLQKKKKRDLELEIMFDLLNHVVNVIIATMKYIAEQFIQFCKNK